jgi:hypothetical protein
MGMLAHTRNTFPSKDHCPDTAHGLIIIIIVIIILLGDPASAVIVVVIAVAAAAQQQGKTQKYRSRYPHDIAPLNSSLWSGL